MLKLLTTFAAGASDWTTSAPARVLARERVGERRHHRLVRAEGRREEHHLGSAHRLVGGRRAEPRVARQGLLERLRARVVRRERHVVTRSLEVIGERGADVAVPEKRDLHARESRHPRDVPQSNAVQGVVARGETDAPHPRGPLYKGLT
jgi:hypothetical protein